MMELKVTESLTCPKCGSDEVANPTAPVEEWTFNIRAYRVCDSYGIWWSQCLVCVATGDKDKGWFK
jgi:hypothetical protein